MTKREPNTRGDTAAREHVRLHPRSPGEVAATAEHIGRVAREGDHVDSVLTNVLHEMLLAFDCERSWLLHPCDPQAASWHVPLECAAPGWPGALTAGQPIPMDESAKALFERALSSREPCAYGPGTEYPLPAAARAFGVRAQLVVPVRPRFGAPWLLGIHHCTTDHSFRADEIDLLRSISLQLGDTLSVLLSLRGVRQQSAELMKANRRLREEITERRRAESELADNEKRLSSLLDHLPDGVAVTTNGAFVYANPRLLAMTGYRQEDLLGTGILDYLVNVDLAVLRRRLDDIMDGFPSTPERYDFRTRSGEVIPVEAFSNPITYHGQPSQLTVVRDIRQRMKMDKQLRQSQKMEAAGRLAGGVAHDFNNLLQSILGNLSLVEGHVQSSETIAANVRAAIVATTHAASLTRRLLILGGKHVGKPEPISIARALEDASQLVRPLLPEDVAFHLSVDVGDAHVQFDPVHFEQVVLNVALNARDALSSGGRLTIDVSAVESPDTVDPRLGPGAWLQLRFIDDGSGMDEATRALATEPFFTTKQAGSGLGLSTVRDLAETYRGRLELESELDHGTTVSIYLPRAEGSTTAQLRASASPAAEPTAGRGESILLVEDDELLLDLMQVVLKAAGYGVVAASGVHQAREAFSRHPGISMLLTDVVMPDGSGLDLAHELSAHSPALRVLLLSGYSAQVLRERSHGALIFEHLEKPVLPKVLLGRIREVFDAP